NYEMDMNDGEVRFKTSIDAEGGELTKPMIDNLLRSNLISMDRYFPGLMAVLYSDRSPADIYEDIASEADRPTLEEDD
ncbi:MAG TPA: hypothetical protein PLX97_16920, partial [Gemmatales bacterium]|nr:hypothetical protein [Gemmatales bacterium]